MSLNNRLGPLRDGLWSGARAFIVGGGPSLKSFDFSRLDGELTIGINRAFEKFDPTIIFGMDSRFWTWLEEGRFGEAARDKFTNYRYGLKLWLNYGKGLGLYPEDFLTLQSLGEQGWSESLESGIGDGNNSGYAALNLAYCLGANPIVLLGFDMKGDGQGKQVWFHDGYPKVQGENVYDRFRGNINRIAPNFRNSGRFVMNCCPDSGLTCFPKVLDFQLGEPERTPVVVAYHTGGGYGLVAERLAESLRPFGFQRDIVEVPDLGSWQANTAYKPEFLLKMMRKYPGRQLIYLDADATMERYPRYLVCEIPAGTDIAAHVRAGNELLSGTLWLSGSESCYSILKAWQNENRDHPNTWDQRNLQAVVEHVGHHFHNIPASYCAIFDRMPEAGQDPHILQWQASRTLKQE